MRKQPSASWCPSDAPQARRLDEQLEAGPALELGVAGRGDVAAHRVGDVGVDVERRGAGRPVPGALLAADRPPRERRARAAAARAPAPAPGRASSAASAGRRGRPRARCRSAPAGCRSPCPRTCGRRSRGRSSPLAGIARCSARAAACTTWKSANRTACCSSRVAVHLHVGAAPHVVEVLALPGQQPVPAGPLRRRERRVDLVAQRRHRARARPAVGEQLDDRQRLARAPARC